MTLDELVDVAHLQLHARLPVPAVLLEELGLTLGTPASKRCVALGLDLQPCKILCG